MNGWKSGFVALLLVAAMVGTPVGAQDAPQAGGLSEEQALLIDRIVQAHAVLDASASYAEESSGISTQSIAFKMLNQTQSSLVSVDWARAATTVHQGDLTTVQANITATVSESGLGANRSYTIEAEVRRIGDTLYVDASYVTPRTDLPDLPRDWAIVEDPDDERYDALQLDDLFDPPQIIDDPELVKRAASDVVLDTETTPDGLTLDVITVSFDREGVALLLTESPNSGMDPALAAQVSETLSDNSFMTLTVKMDAEDTPYLYTSQTSVRLLNVPASAVAPGQLSEGVTIDFVLESSRSEAYSQHNEPLAPAAAPM